MQTEAKKTGFMGEEEEKLMKVEEIWRQRRWWKEDSNKGDGEVEGGGGNEDDGGVEGGGGNEGDGDVEGGGGAKLD